MIIRAHIDAARRTHRIDGALITHNSDIELQLAAEEGSGFDLSEAVSAIFVTDRGSYDAVVSSTGSFAVPVLSASDGRYCFVGFQQGEVRTTTDAKFLIQRSIKDIKNTNADPQAASFDPIYGSLAESDYIQVKRSSDGKRGSATIETLRELMGGGGVTIEPYTGNPAMDGTASAGSSDAYARGDHVHPTDTSRASQERLESVEYTVGGIGESVQSLDYAVGQIIRDVDTKYAKPTGGIPKTDLASGVQSSLDKADSALQSHQSLAAYRTSADQDVIDGAQDTAIAAKYAKPSGGIPKTDLASDVQTSLGKADTALQTAPVSSVNGQTGAVVLGAADVGAAPAITEVTVDTAGAVTQALDAGKMYHFTGALTSLTLTLNAAASGQLAQYHFDFTEGSTAFDPVLPNGVVLPDSHTWAADTRYEVDILNGYAVIVGWAVSA